MEHGEDFPGARILFGAEVVYYPCDGRDKRNKWDARGQLGVFFFAS